MKQGDKKHRHHHDEEKAHETHNGGVGHGTSSYATPISDDLFKEAEASVNGAAEEPPSAEVPIVEDAGDRAAAGGDAASREVGAAVGRLTAEVSEWKDRALRATADLENFRKRTLREREDFQKFAVEALVRDLLPVADNVDHAMAHIESSDLPTVRTGIEMTYRSFLDALKKKGVAPFDSQGRAFDPNLHEAVQTTPSDEVPAGHVVAEVRRGYMMHDRLLRAALVVVSTGRMKGDGAHGGHGEPAAADTPEDEPQS